MGIRSLHEIRSVRYSQNEMSSLRHVFFNLENNWVKRFTPEFVRHWNRLGMPTRRS